MGNFELKNIIQKLGIIKDYSSLVIPIIIIIIAIVLFVPGQLIGIKLKKEIADKSIAACGDRIDGLSKQIIASKQWEVERDYQQAYKEDAEQISNLTMQSTMRPLLSYKIFPDTNDPSAAELFKDFGKQFRESIDKQLERLKAITCPTETELANSLPAKSGSPSSSSLSRSGNKSRRKVNDIETMIKDALCRKKAESGLVYITPSDISGYEFWKNYEYSSKEDAVIDCWHWQLGYWVMEDVFGTIYNLNSGSNNAYSSPVKRLLGISFIKDQDSEKVKSGAPYYVTSDTDGLTTSLTKRFSDAEIDVVQFDISVLVSTKAVLPFMKELCIAKQHKFRGFTGEDKEQSFMHNQITILQSTTESIDPDEASHELYRYGDEDNVVKLDLICEYIFNKNGYEKIKPE
jgi:hypothetical protein